MVSQCRFVIGISTLIAFVSLFDVVNPWLTPALGIKLQMGTWAVIAAHVLFNIAVVALLVSMSKGKTQ